MSGCQTCGGFGNRHDPIAHGAEEAERETSIACPRCRWLLWPVRPDGTALCPVHGWYRLEPVEGDA